MGKDRLLKTCAVCGAEFHAVRTFQVCCSHECRKKHKCDLQNRRNAKRRAGKPLPQAKELTCPVCGKQFQSKIVRKYCSVECKRQAMKAYHAQHSKQVSCDLTPPPTRKCHDCGEPTDNYRCAECQAKWKAKYAVTSVGDVEETYAIC